MPGVLPLLHIVCLSDCDNMAIRCCPTAERCFYDPWVGNTKGGVGKTTLAVNLVIARLVRPATYCLSMGTSRQPHLPLRSFEPSRLGRPVTPRSHSREPQSEPRCGNLP